MSLFYMEFAMEQQKVEKGDKVKVHYTGTLENGEVFDTSRNEEPLEFEAGSEELIPGFSNGVIGMSVGEKKTVEIKPEDAYGQRIDGLLQEVPISMLPQGVKVGDMLSADIEGHQMIFTVVDIKGDTALLDGNHPLAGHTLTFEIELMSVDKQK